MKTVIEMAREAGLRSAVLLHMYGKESALCDSEIEELRQLERFAEIVRADEREACAGECDEWIKNGLALAEDIAAAIRARSNT
jgi:hypothetical protein